jgi:hypothetical protein
MGRGLGAECWVLVLVLVLVQRVLGSRQEWMNVVVRSVRLSCGEEKFAFVVDERVDNSSA